MHPIKWLRKHMTKLMAVFVIAIMVAFIMPTVLQQLARPRSAGPAKAMWYYDTDTGISFNDIQQASNELAAMKMLGIDRALLSMKDLRQLLLGHLLFPETAQGTEMSDRIKMIVAQNQLYINPSRIDDYFTQARERPELFWLLLKAEIRKAGYAASQRHAGEFLTALIPQITNGKGDAQTLVRMAGQANQMTDDMVISAFADVLAVSNYARIITDTEDVTEAETQSTLSKMMETIDVEIVDFDCEKFIEKTDMPSEEEISVQFEKYKGVFPNIPTTENPYGFGYKQGPRAAIEYVIIKTDDAKKLVSPPSEEETEEFYRQNISRFVEQIPKDANDPNSEQIVRQKSYAEVAAGIKKGLFTQKAGKKARSILDDIVERSQAGLGSLNPETAAIEQLKEKLTDYASAAEKVAKQNNNIKIYAGKTSLLTAEEIQHDRSLGALMIAGQSRMPVTLARLVFSLEQLGDEAANLGPFDPPRAKMFVDIGPFTEMTGAAIAMVRVIDFKNSSVPDLNFSYEKNLPQVIDDPMPKEKSFVLKEKVEQDCRRVAAFEIARQKSGEFVKLAKDKGWDEATKKFNQLYPIKDNNEGLADFEIQKWDGRNRILQRDIEMIKLQTAQMPGMETLIRKRTVNAILANELYCLFDTNGNQTELANVPMVFEFKPQPACYVIKSLIRHPVTSDVYEQARAPIAYRENSIQSQSMGIEHFMPSNIFKRLNFRPAEPTAPTDANGVDL